MRVLVALCALFLLPVLAAQETSILPEPSEYPPCDLPEPVLFAQVDGMLENLAFDGNGSLFVTAFEEGLFRIDTNGTVEHVAASDRTRGADEVEPVMISTAFMGVVVGADGALYVSEGHAIGPEIEARVLRFPEPGGPGFEVFAEGFPNANGLAADHEGNLYLAHGFRDELWRIEPDGSWEVWTSVPDAVNGVFAHPDEEHLVIAPLGDSANTVYKVPLDDADGREAIYRFNAAPSPAGGQGPSLGRPLFTKGIDDLGITQDGRVLVSGHFRSQFLMGDPDTGRACILLDGARAEPSSIREAHGFGEWDGWAFTTDFSGDVWAIDIRTEAPGPSGEDDPEPDDVDPAATPGVLPALVGAAIVLLLARARRHR